MRAQPIWRALAHWQQGETGGFLASRGGLCQSAGTMGPYLVLASASPRRRDLLRRLGLPFVVDAADIPEDAGMGESASSLALRLAVEKARAVQGRHPGAVILGADTVVALENEVFGKPRDEADARRMLKRLSGRLHEVITGVALAAPEAPVEAWACVTRVGFRNLSQAEIDAYVASGEPFDKAGAYAVQGQAAGFVTTLDGLRSNVVGLPIEEVEVRLRRILEPASLGDGA